MNESGQITTIVYIRGGLYTGKHDSVFSIPILNRYHGKKKKKSYWIIWQNLKYKFYKLIKQNKKNIINQVY